MNLEKQIEVIFYKYLNFHIGASQFVAEISELVLWPKQQPHQSRSAWWTHCEENSNKIKKEILKQAKCTLRTDGILILLCDKVFGRCEIFEEQLSRDPYVLNTYALKIIKNKLPEELHNKMLAFHLEHPNDEIIKNYFKLYG